MRVNSNRMPAISLWIGVLLLIGCGSSSDQGIVVTGRLLKNGKPAQVDFVGRKLPPGVSGRLTVIFYPVKSDNDAIAGEHGEVLVPGGEWAAVEDDGTFHIGKGQQKGIKPGKYRIVITHVDPSSEQDVLKGVFNESKSKITRDISAGQEIVIDLAKPSG